MECDESGDATRLTKRPRKSRPKVKTGCLTCKARRVKCDEARPECIRCQKSGRSCEGYPLALKGPPRALAPRNPPSNTSSAICRPLLQKASMSIPRSPSSSLFDDEMEGNYFQLYCTKTATKLGGLWDASIWGRLIIQACYEEPFARHGIISIAALDLGMEMEAFLPSKSSTSDRENPMGIHHQFALREYGKALRLMRSSKSEDEAHHVRKALISCLLIICFELYRGDPELAMIQARTAVQVLSQWLKKIQGYKALPPSTNKSSVVEDDLINAFARLYKGVMVFRAPRPTEFSELLMPDAIDKLNNIPEKFCSLAEARQYWELHLRLALPWNHQPGFDALQASAFPKMHPDKIRNREPDVVVSAQDEKFTAGLEEQRRAHVSHLLNWLKAFTPLWEYCQNIGPPEDFAGAAVLKMQSNCGYISFAAAMVNHETIYDKFYDQFAEMVSLAKKVLEISEQGKSPHSTRFSFSIGVTNCLYFVVCKCRDRLLRRDILELLKAHPRRNGVWDSAMVVAIGKWHMEKEEQGLGEDELIPEAKRIRVMEVKLPSSKQEAVISYTMMERSPRERVMLPVEKVVF